MSKSKKCVLRYYVYGYLKGFDNEEYPIFQYASKSIYRITEFVSTVNFDHIDLQVVREFVNGSFSQLDISQLKEIADEIF